MELRSTKEQQRVNLALLTQEYKEKTEARPGFERLLQLIVDNRADQLGVLLRDHSTEGDVTDTDELTFRYQVDLLLQYYSVVEIAILAGQVPPELTPTLRLEVETVLGNAQVKKYYEVHYPLLLPAVLFKAVRDNYRQPVLNGATVFRQLVEITGRRDEDEEVFLDLLDDFILDGYSIDDLVGLLGDKEGIRQVLVKERKKEGTLDKAFWGFYRFCDKMLAYERLLKGCRSPLLKSAIWHLQSYWFEGMRQAMEGKYLKGIRTIKQVAASISMEEYTQAFDKRELKEGEEAIQFAVYYREWKKESDTAIKKLTAAIQYNLQRTHGQHLRNYLRDIDIYTVSQMKEIIEQSDLGNVWSTNRSKRLIGMRDLADQINIQARITWVELLYPEKRKDEIVPRSGDLPSNKTSLIKGAQEPGEFFPKIVFTDVAFFGRTYPFDAGSWQSYRTSANGLLENIANTFLKLRKGFSFVKLVYDVVDRYECSLLFYQFKIRRFVIVRLALIKESHAELVGVFNKIDNEYRNAEDPNAIGILLQRAGKLTHISYCLPASSNTSMPLVDYKILPEVPAELSADIPSKDELEHELSTDG